MKKTLPWKNIWQRYRNIDLTLDMSKQHLFYPSLITRKQQWHILKISLQGIISEYAIVNWKFAWKDFYIDGNKIDLICGNHRIFRRSIEEIVEKNIFDDYQ